MTGRWWWLALGASGIWAAPAQAQHTADNAVTSAEDAFGTSIGHEQIGLYDDSNVRGFSPSTAANFRIEGMYFDAESNIGGRLIDGETIRVGPAAQGYAFPAPTGIADLTLRTSGDALHISPIVSADSYGGQSLEVDAQVPLIAKTLSTAIGFGLFHNVYNFGGSNRKWNFGIVPRWHPAHNVEVIAFFDREQVHGDSSQPVYLPTGNFLPDLVPRSLYPGPDWARTNDYSETFGTVVRANLGEWTLRAGAFRSIGVWGTNWGNDIVVNPNMSTDRLVEAFPASTGGSFSGELRVSRRLREGPRQHLLTVALRGRDILSQYGGGALADLGAAGLAQAINPPEPAFATGPLTNDRTHQVTAGASYGLAWKGVGDVTLGVQRTRYIKAVDQPGVPFAHRVNDVWLPSASAAVHVTQAVTAYGSFVRGLEDAGAAPTYAANPGQLIPAIRTRQFDAGLKWKLAKTATLIVGWYDIQKPYINLDNADLYRVLGTETHRGIETSLTANLAKGLTVVAGGMFARPRVAAQPSLGQPIGALPVGQFSTSTRLNVNYALPFAKAVTMDAYVNHDGRSAGTVDNAVMLPGSTRFGLGARYGFKLGGKDFTLRVSANNIGNTFRWVAVGSGAYAFNSPRNVQAYLAADF